MLIHYKITNCTKPYHECPLKIQLLTMTMTMTMKISLFDINHLNTMIRKNKAEKNNVVNEQETIQNNIKCRYRRPTP